MFINIKWVDNPFSKQNCKRFIYCLHAVTLSSLMDISLLITKSTCDTKQVYIVYSFTLMDFLFTLKTNVICSKYMFR